MQYFLCSIFHVFKNGKWNELKIKLACVTNFLNTRLGIYRFPMYVKTKKLKCSIFHVFRFLLISRKRFHVQRRSIYSWKAIEKAGDRLVLFSIRSIFPGWKRGKRNIEDFACSVFHDFSRGKWNGLEIKPAYVARLFNSFLEIHRSLLYVKAFPKYKRKTKHVENGTL